MCEILTLANKQINYWTRTKQNSDNGCYNRYITEHKQFGTFNKNNYVKIYNFSIS